jgi:hypothetical protein
MLRGVTACEGLHLSWQTCEQAVRDKRLGRAQSRKILGAATQLSCQPLAGGRGGAEPKAAAELVLQRCVLPLRL